jgi:hypothetical protein
MLKNIMNKLLFAAGIFLLFNTFIHAQNRDEQLGSGSNFLKQSITPTVFDFSDPESVNIKVAVWGGTRITGRFIIPIYSTVNDLLSYAGGPLETANMEDIRIYRTNPDSSQSIISLKYNDLLYNTETRETPKYIPLQGGDILLVSVTQRFIFRDYISWGLSIVATLASIASLIIISRK